MVGHSGTDRALAISRQCRFHAASGSTHRYRQPTQSAEIRCSLQRSIGHFNPHSRPDDRSGCAYGQTAVGTGRLGYGAIAIKLHSEDFGISSFEDIPNSPSFDDCRKLSCIKSIWIEIIFVYLFKN